MARILAIDFGKKRTGIAVTDSLKIIANGLDTIETPKLLDWLGKYIEKEPVEMFVVGKATRFSGEDSEVMPLAREFVAKLENKFPTIPVTWVDERFTSKMAFQTMVDSGLKKSDRKDKSLIDKISATIILQSYLEQIRNSL